MALTAKMGPVVVEEAGEEEAGEEEEAVVEAGEEEEVVEAVVTEVVVVLLGAASLSSSSSDSSRSYSRLSACSMMKPWAPVKLMGAAEARFTVTQVSRQCLFYKRRQTAVVR